MLSLFTVLLFSMPSHATERPQTIALVGIDARGDSVTQEIPLPVYRDTLKGAFSAVHDSLAPALARRANPAPGRNWALRTLSIAIGFAAQIGLGPLWSLSGSAHYHLIYTNSLNPIYPD
jgi:hypothetical protein